MCGKSPEQNEEAEKEDEMAKLKEKLLKLLNEDSDIRAAIEVICNEKSSEQPVCTDANEVVRPNEEVTKKDCIINELLNKCDDLKQDIYKKEKEIHEGEKSQAALRLELDAAKKDFNTKTNEQAITIENIKENNGRLKTDNENLTTDLQGVKKENEILKGRVISEDLISLLEHIRKDDELIRRFELPADPEVRTPDFLLAAVAVLAQSNNFKRLWEFYKDRCVDKKGPLTDADLKVLLTVLAWLNANWPTKPYTLYSPVPGEGYDYEKHMRPPGANTGDKIQAIWLPGVIELKLKPLVATH